MHRTLATTLLAALLTLSMALAHGSAAHDRHGHAAGTSANLVHADGVAFLVEPLIALGGAMKLAVTMTRDGEAFAHSGRFAVTTPSGAFHEGETDGAVALIELGDVDEGTYHVVGTLGPHHLETSFTTYRQTTAMGAEMILVLAPSACDRHPSEAFVYAFEDGENIHRLFTITLAGAHTHHEPVTLVHTHFREAFNAESFQPMANHTTVSFGRAGDWTLEVAIHGGMPDHATFTVRVPPH